MKNRLDRDKYLRKLKFKRLWRRYERYVYLGVSCLVIAIIGIYFAHSKFSTSSEEEVIRTVVGDFIHGDVVIGAYVDGEYSLTIPGKNDGYVVNNIVCDNNATGTWDDDNWGLLTTNMTKRTKCNMYFEKKVTLVDKVTTLSSSDTTNFATDDADNNVRYIGANPDNYVYFNCSDYNNQSDSTCEKWRIIGVFNNVTKSDGTKENLVKIIRDESIGNYSWDSSDSSTNTGYGVNDWTDAAMMKLLNGGYESESIGGSLYWNAKSGTCYYSSNNATTFCDFTSTGLKNDVTKSVIENVVWNIGGSSAYNNVIPSMFYEIERETKTDKAIKTNWTGRVGLVYPSDYGYATSGNSSTNRKACLAKELYNWNNLNDCSYNNYLYKSEYHQWTVVPYYGDTFNLFIINSSGIVNRHSAGLKGVGTRPTLFLKSNISINSGTGSSDNPYQLNL